MDFAEALLVDTFRYSFFAFFVSISGIMGLAWSFLVLRTCITFPKIPQVLDTTPQTNKSNGETTDFYTNLLSKLVDKTFDKALEKYNVD
jgi:hypothetical protein